MTTLFAKKAYRVVKNIPKGKVSTYQAVARAIHKPRASRAVGHALKCNPYAPQVPCHRVIRSDGTVGGYARGAKKKIEFLKQEGIIVIGKKIDLHVFGWRV
ncbi:MGMT family protein [Candidatus Jorgensenbacteria bacterium]|nr:MGMT family protein [Candidatus Jorgensenbacteria bacterium]